MSMWLRAGPLRVSSRGRVGVRVGPVGVYGGGRRRRRASASDSAFLGVFVLLAIVLVILFFVVMWPLTLFGHAIRLTPSWHQLLNRNHTWMHQHYALVGLRYLGAATILLVLLTAVAVPLSSAGRKRATEQRHRAAQLAAEEEQRARATYLEWLEGPPPVLQMPTRFTANWIATNVPDLHPGQVPMLMGELKRRGWSDSDIERRVMPYIPDYDSLLDALRVA